MFTNGECSITGPLFVAFYLTQLTQVLVQLVPMESINPQPKWARGRKPHKTKRMKRENLKRLSHRDSR